MILLLRRIFTVSSVMLVSLPYLFILFLFSSGVSTYEKSIKNIFGLNFTLVAKFLSTTLFCLYYVLFQVLFKQKKIRSTSLENALLTLCTFGVLKRMEGLTVHGIDDNGFDDSSLDLDLNLKCSPKATLEDLISENVYASENPEKIHLIKRSEDDEEVLEDLSTILDEVMEDKDSLYFYITPFAREGVTVNLKVTKEAMEWINANTKVGIKFLVGTSKDFIVSFPLKSSMTLYLKFRY